MKTLHEIFRELGICWSDDFYNNMERYWDDCHDAIFVYNTETEKARFGRIPKCNWFLSDNEVLIARMSKPSEYSYDFDDFFSEEELEEIRDNFDGDWSEWLSQHTNYTLEERINDTAKCYLENNWSQFYNEMEAQLMEAQKEVDNEKD